MKQFGEFGSDCVLFLGPFQGASELPEHFELSGHNRFQARGDVKEMVRHAPIKLNCQVRCEFVSWQFPVSSQGCGDLIDGPVKAIDDGVDLGTQTR